MYGRFSLGATIRVGHVFDMPNRPETPPRYNIAPSQDVPAVIQNRETGRREFRPFRWGLVPSWAKDAAIGNRMINARSETAATKLAFRMPLRDLDDHAECRAPTYPRPHAGGPAPHRLHRVA